MWKSMSALICVVAAARLVLDAVHGDAERLDLFAVRPLGRPRGGRRLDDLAHLEQGVDEASLGFWSTCQRSTSGSSMFQSTVGRTRVPIFGRDEVRPLAERGVIASRTAVRETPNSSWMRGSVGSVSPGLYLPGNNPPADRPGDHFRKTALPAAVAAYVRVCANGANPPLLCPPYHIILSLRQSPEHAISSNADSIRSETFDGKLRAISRSA